MMKKRIYYLDVLRVLACLMVIAMHAPLPSVGHTGNFLCAEGLFCVPCIGLFFMISGALLLPVQETGVSFVKKRLAKVVFPLLVWICVGIVIEALQKGTPEPAALLRTIFSIPFSVQGSGILWFVYPLIGLYLLAPVISPWLEKAGRTELKLFLLLWAVSLCFPYLKDILDIETSKKGILYYFSGYLGYFVLGYYLHNFGRAKTWIAIALLPIPFVVGALFKYWGLHLSVSYHFGYLSLVGAMMSWSWFTIVRNLSQRIDGLNPGALSVLQHFSTCCFGIYLIHIYVMRPFLWDVCHISLLGRWSSLLVSFFGTLLISYGLTVLFSKLPFGKYIVGFSSRR